MIRDTYFKGITTVPWTALRFRITLGIMIILCFLFLIFAKIAITEQRARMLQQIEDYGAETTQFIAQIAIIPLQKFSIYQLENYVEQFEQGTLVAYCMIYDKKGQLITHNRVNGENKKTKTINGASPLIKTFSAEINENGVYYGRVEVGLYVDSVYSKIDRTSLYILAAFCGGVLVIGGAVSFFIHRQFVRPILHLSKTTRTIAEGHFVTSDMSLRKDEIGELAESINLMSSNLEDSYRTLEKKVDERTAELYHAKNMAEKSSSHLQVVGAEVQALLDNSPVGIVFVTNDFSILRINQEFCRITGFTSEEIVGKSMRIFFRELSTFVEFNKSSGKLDKDGLFDKRTELMKKDGSVISCAVRGRKTMISGGAQGIVLNFEDISSRLLIEEELLKIKKLESLRVLARGIAHDFNNMLVAILGNLSLVERFTANDQQVSGLLAEARKASLRAKDLTEKLLTFAKGSEPDSKVEHLSELLKKSIPVVLAGSSIQCDFDFEDGLWKVQMDKSQIDTVVQNIVQNAKEAMEAGGQLRISCANEVISAQQNSTLADGRYVKITIADSGVGIAAECIEKVFDPYFSTKEKDSNQGSGLGLSIVRSIMMKHKGAVSIDSPKGVGAEVTVYLPAAHEDPKVEKTPSQILPTGKGHVVVIDADSEIQSLTEEMLSYLGYTYVPSVTLEHAVVEIEGLMTDVKKNVTVLMASSVLGGMSKSNISELFKSFSPKIRLVLCHGEQDDSAVLDSLESDFDAVVKRPFQLLDLSRVLSAAGAKG